MVSTELSAAVLLADALLYGFMVLYYTTSTALREQEKTWITLRAGSHVKGDEESEDRKPVLSEAERRWVNALAGAAANNMFLLGCTLFAVPSLYLGVLSLLGFEVLGLWAVIFFLVFVIVVAVGMVGVGIQTFRRNIGEARETLGADTPLMDILNRGLGKQ